MRSRTLQVLLATLPQDTQGENGQSRSRHVIGRSLIVPRHSLSGTEKSNYIKAVQCLQTKPSISGNLAPGAKSRYDDFVGAVSLHNTSPASITNILCVAHQSDTDHPWNRQLPVMAPILRLHLREGPSIRVWLHWLPALPQLGQDCLKPTRLSAI